MKIPESIIIPYYYKNNHQLSNDIISLPINPPQQSNLIKNLNQIKSSHKTSSTITPSPNLPNKKP